MAVGTSQSLSEGTIVRRLEKISPSALAPCGIALPALGRSLNPARPLRSSEDDASFIYPLDALASSVLRC